MFGPGATPRGRSQNAILSKLLSGFHGIASIWNELLYPSRKAAHSRLATLLFFSDREKLAPPNPAFKLLVHAAAVSDFLACFSLRYHTFFHSNT